MSGASLARFAGLDLGFLKDLDRLPDAGVDFSRHRG
jgi:hypothetical protein